MSESGVASLPTYEKMTGEGVSKQSQMGRRFVANNEEAIDPRTVGMTTERKRDGAVYYIR